MRRTQTMLAAAAFAALFALPAQGQVKLGIAGGGSFASFTGDDIQEISMEPGGTAGLILSFPLLGRLRLETGAAWAQRRMSVEVSDGDGGTISSVTSLAYLEVPLTLDILLFERSRWAFALKGGPSIAMNVQEPERPEGPVYSASFLDDLDYRSNDFSLTAGGSIGYERLFVDARYAFGLENAVEKAEGAPELESRAFTILLGGWIPLGGGPDLSARR